MSKFQNTLGTVPEPKNDNDIANKKYVDSNIRELYPVSLLTANGTFLPTKFVAEYNYRRYFFSLSGMANENIGLKNITFQIIDVESGEFAGVFSLQMFFNVIQQHMAFPSKMYHISYPLVKDREYEIILLSGADDFLIDNTDTKTITFF